MVTGYLKAVKGTPPEFVLPRFSRVLQEARAMWAEGGLVKAWVAPENAVMGADTAMPLSQAYALVAGLLESD